MRPGSVPTIGRAPGLGRLPARISRNGFTAAACIRGRVEEIGIRLCNHCYSLLTVVASLQWLSTYRDVFLLEDCVEDSPLRYELTHEKCRPPTVLDRPGHFVAAHLVCESGQVET